MSLFKKDYYEIRFTEKVFDNPQEALNYVSKIEDILPEDADMSVVKTPLGYQIEVRGWLTKEDINKIKYILEG